jgi:hypothetical protein
MRYTYFSRFSCVIAAQCGMNGQTIHRSCSLDMKICVFFITFRIKFKTAILMYIIHTNHSPSYISQALSTAACNPSRQSLRSANSTDYLIPRTSAKFGKRASSVSGPAIWNSLPESLRSASSINIFKSRMKTHFITLAHKL